MKKGNAPFRLVYFEQNHKNGAPAAATLFSSASQGTECIVAALKEPSSCTATAKLADSSAYYISMGD